MKKTKIMAIGDIHGDTGLVKKLAKMAKDEKVDIIILPGDLTWLEQSTKNFLKIFLFALRRILNLDIAKLILHVSPMSFLFPSPF